MSAPFDPARRRWLRGSLGAGVLAVAGIATQARPRLVNPCEASMPDDLATHPRVVAAWHGLDPERVWDCHAHLAGVGDVASGIRISPRMLSPWHPAEYVQRLFYMNAACVEDAPGRVDDSFVERLHDLMGDMPAGFKLMLYAFEQAHDGRGRPLPAASAFHVPDHWARRIAHAAPARFEWVCSIHPYRPDALDALESAVAGGARAVKWLPPAMAIDPADPACDRFYATLARLGLPLITHAGEERAVQGVGRPDWGNPLRLRRALDHGVRVVLAHCASLGEDLDLDRGAAAQPVPSFELFARMMDEPRARTRLFGDISAVVFRNRAPGVVRRLIETDDWHGRLLYGSDYPLPGVLPLTSPSSLAAAGLLDDDVVDLLDRLQLVNPLLFDLVLKRSLRSGDRVLPARVFETRRVFDRGES
ncbi:MAG: amidohydrolase family protein [Zoogloeaceae bacterium]|nr:amidohydrolase family protein [Rhodocyclaceae bacterium]MCP5237145.1 amidohydrolase family protein [Zoogloeaceae bacterium]